MTTDVDINPAVALNERTAEAEAEIAFHKGWNRTRRLLLAQEAHVLRQTVAAQKAEIERLTKLIPPESAPAEAPSPKPKTPAGAAATTKE